MDETPSRSRSPNTPGPRRPQRPRPATPVPAAPEPQPSAVSREIRSERPGRYERLDRPRHTFPEKEDEVAVVPAWLAVARGSALFLGVLMLLTLLGDIRSVAQTANFVWLDFTPAPVPWARGFLGFFGSLLTLFACFPSMPRLFRALAVLCVFAALGIAGWNAFRFYEQMRGGFIHSRLPIPLSLHIGALLVVVLAGLFAGRRKSMRPGRDFFFALVTFVICTVGFPVAQIFCNGQTNERRAADAAVVFACDLPRGDEAGNVLEERVKTASALYNDKLVRTLILSGGPGPDGVHQSEEMRRIAVGLGVAETDILPETTGTDTRSAVAGSLDHLQQNQFFNVLVVNDFHLLPRIKLAYRRAGITVETVPVESSMDPARWKKAPNEIAGEAASLLLFYVEPLML